MTSKIENLSSEILVEIFSYYIESEGHMAFSRNVAPVCKTFWNVSSTPSLYKSFHVENWKYARSLCKRDLLYYTLNLKLSPLYATPYQNLLDSSQLLAVLSNINNLKSLEISNYDIDINTMMIVAECCPNIESLSVTRVGSQDVMKSDEDRDLTLEELSPILTTCGQKLKHVSFTSCLLQDTEQLFTEIASKCESLETLKFSNKSYYYDRLDRNKFPIYEFVSGCPRLRKLELSNCELVAGSEENRSGFKNLTMFKALGCCSHELNSCNLLKDSTSLEHLELVFSSCSALSIISEIQSNNIKFLNVRFANIFTTTEAVEQAVDKWKHTLLHLGITVACGDLTGILRIYLDDNPCPKLEALSIDRESVDLNFLKIFIQKCQNLKRLWILQEQGSKVLNREEAIEFLDFLEQSPNYYEKYRYLYNLLH